MLTNLDISGIYEYENTEVEAISTEDGMIIASRNWSHVW